VTSNGQPIPPTPDTAGILRSIGEVAYEWHIASDALWWSDNADGVLLIGDRAAMSTGSGFARFLDADNAQARFEAVTKSDKHDDGHGVA
jgi:hypothetical protein